MVRLCVRMQIQSGLGEHPPALVYEAAQDAGLHRMGKHDYNVGVCAPSVRTVQEWLLRIYETLVPVSLIRSGKAPDEKTAKEQSAEFYDATEKLFATGYVPDGTISVVVAQKPKSAVG
jgi:hypothetical protein